MTSTKQVFVLILTLFQVNLCAQQKGIYTPAQQISLYDIPDNFDLTVKDFAIHPNERQLLIAGELQNLTLWDLQTGSFLKSVSSSENADAIHIYDLAFSKDGLYLATVGNTIDYEDLPSREQDGSIKIKTKTLQYKALNLYDATNYSLIKQFLYDTASTVFSCVFSHDNQFLFTAEELEGSNNQTMIRVYKTGTWTEVLQTQIEALYWQIVVSKSNKLYLGTKEGIIKVMQFKDMQLTPIYTIPWSSSDIEQIEVSQDEQLLWALGDSVKLHHLNEQTTQTIPVELNEYDQISFSPNSAYFLHSNFYNMVSLYHRASMKVVQSFDLPKLFPNDQDDHFSISRLVFSDTGTYIALNPLTSSKLLLLKKLTE